ncbi:Unknown protein sequence [Pseudomonas syringae pv. castaneae]|uniref:Uncharacterized protein n=1 Tax=Pseudomonas syringae pv. castaneae TaxID=264450 RepID=A0A0P9NLE9_PSESX|nr:Unknown protein sequence [Pseudomonas syringae pv. castaneae]
MRLKTDDLGGVYADALGLVHFLFHCSPHLYQRHIKITFPGKVYIATFSASLTLKIIL